MHALDGNAIAGTLRSVFGTDMTAATGTCAHCGSRGRLAEVAVYQHGPGIVARCRQCTGLLVVITEIRGVACVDLMGLETLSTA
jgi:Family of unknown function (DUF6510)